METFELSRVCVCVSSTEDWEAVVSITSVLLPSSLRCGNLLPTEQLYTVTLPHRNRYQLLHTICDCVRERPLYPVCLFSSLTDLFKYFRCWYGFIAAEELHHYNVITSTCPGLSALYESGLYLYSYFTVPCGTVYH